MLLYRAQSVPSGRRLRAPKDNTPAMRISGRWFTEDLEAAYRHLARIEGPSQIVCVEIDDAIARTFLVACTPVTRCGLEPIHYSEAPLRDYVIPRFFAAQSEEIETVADEGMAEMAMVDFATPARQAA